MKLDQILKDIKNKVYYPVYLLHGEESYFIDQISDQLEHNVLNEMEKEFNLTVLYGRDIQTQDLINAAKRYPMMSNYQVILVKEAQSLSKIEDLSSYLDNPVSTTILVLCYKHKKADKRRKYVTQIEKKGVLFLSEKLKEEKLAAWIYQYISEKKYSIGHENAQLLADYLTNDLTVITNELDKLFINLPAGSLINADHIEKNIGISKDYNVFELQNALAERNVLKANKIIQYFGSNPKDNSIIQTIAILYEFYIRVLITHQLKQTSDKELAAAIERPVFFLSNFKLAARNYSMGKVINIMSLLKEYDLKAKGVRNLASEAALYQRLTYKILH